MLRTIGRWLRAGYWLVAAAPVRADVREVTSFQGGRRISGTSWTWYPPEGFDRRHRRAQGHL